MNAPHSASPLASVQMAPKDPILGVTETFNADKNPHKVNLGVGIYYDDSGKVPLLECVRHAEMQLAERSAPISCVACCRNPRSGFRIRVGKTTGPCSRTRDSRSTTIPTTTRPRTA